MEQDDVILVDFFDVICHPLSGLIQALRFIDDSRLFIGADIVLIIELAYILIR
jgi:hypothetical protein